LSAIGKLVNISLAEKFSPKLASRNIR